jgi:beta-glucosidase
MAKFFWGASSSAHQAEGGNRNDWTEWETKNAKFLVNAAKNHTPAGGWPSYIIRNYPNPLQEENYISGRASDHYNRFEEDFEIAKNSIARRSIK